MAEFVTPKVLQQVQEKRELERAKEAMTRLKKEQEEAAHLRAAFMEREIRADMPERLNAAITRAAEAGHHELQLFTFPASFCNDGGRRINNQEPDWPTSLEGFAKRAYDAYEANLKALGYRVRCQVVSYPDGNIGEIAMILSW